MVQAAQTVRGAVKPGQRRVRAVAVVAVKHRAAAQQAGPMASVHLTRRGKACHAAPVLRRVPSAAMMTTPSRARTCLRASRRQACLPAVAATAAAAAGVALVEVEAALEEVDRVVARVVAPVAEATVTEPSQGR